MSIIQTIRDKAAWFFTGAIALALIAFIVQDGFRNKSLFGGSTTTLGRVEGKKIDYIEFETRMKKIEDVYAQRGMPMDEASREGERDRLWNEYVEKAVMLPEYDKLGLEVTDREVGDILYGANPPQDLRQQFTDPQTGVYKANEAYQQIQQIRKQKNSEAYKSFFGEYIPALVNYRKREKFEAMMRSSVYIPKWLVEKTNIENSQMASFSYVNIPYSTITDSTIKVTDDEINAYIAKHKDAFKQDKARAIEYVAFDAGPSKADSLAVWQQLQNLKDSFAKTTDIKTFLQNENSQSPYYDSYINKKDIKNPNIDSIVKVPIGQVYGPYLDAGSYAMSRVMDIKQLPDTVKVRHILVATHQRNPQTGELVPVREDSTAKKLADSIALAIKNGSNFDTLCLKYSDDDPSNKSKGGVYDKITTGGMVPSFNDFIFEKKTGDKGVVKTEFGYHYIEILSQQGSSPAYKIAYLSKPVSASDETVNTANGLATQFAAESRTQKEFDDNIKKRNLNKFNAADIKPMETSVLGLNGNARELIRWMFRDAKVGEVADRPFNIGEKYIVPVLTVTYDEGTMDAKRARPNVEPLIKSEKKATEIVKKLGNNITSLEAVGKQMNLPINRADSVSFSSPFIPNVGQEVKVIGAAFNKNNQLKVSAPISGQLGVFLLKTEKIGAVANTGMDIRFQQTMLAENAKRSQANIVQVFLQAADIKDYRYKFF